MMDFGQLNSVQLVGSAALGWAIKYTQDKISAARAPGKRLKRLMHVLPITNHRVQNTIRIRTSVDIFAAGEGIKSKRGYTHISEAIALQVIADVVHGLPSIKLAFDHGPQIDAVDSCRIVLGLSRTKSKISNRLFDRIGTSTGIDLIKGTTVHQYFRDRQGTEYKCEHIEDPDFSTRVIKDYGMIYRCVGDSGGALLLCGGIHMFGTQAAVQVALGDEFIERVEGAGCREFLQLVEVSVHDDGITIDLDSVRWRDLPFIPVQLKS
jgi:hypothetical protein